MKTLNKIIQRLKPGEPEAAARKQLEEAKAQIVADRTEAEAIDRDVAGWKKQLEAIHAKGWNVSVSDGEAAQSLMGKIDVASIRRQSLDAAMQSTQSVITSLVGNFPRLQELVHA